MKRYFKSTVTLILVSLVCLLVLPPGARADDPSPPLTAPLNPAFVESLSGPAAGDLTSATSTGHRPEPLAPITTTSDPLNASASFPASYDLRSSGRLTPIRDQGELGNCWTFASLGSLESYLQPTATTDLSENNLRWNNGFDYGLDAGGNATMAMAYLARWSGPVSESSDPYYSAQKSGLEPLYHVQQMEYLPESATAIKAALMADGALYASIYAGAFDDYRYYNENTAALYYTGFAAIDHDIVIVGWDDNYDRSNFSNPPPGNGAWIIRNSWGSDWGQAGYFYLSYYDRYAMANPTAFHNAEATSNYSRNYQYDPLGKTTARGYDSGDQSSWGANIFTAAASENLTAISTYALSPNTTIDIQIYTNVSAGAPSSGQLRSTQTVSFANAGYYTVALKTPVSLTANQNFAVVIKYSTPETAYPVPVEAPFYGYSSSASANAGESFTSANGSSDWYDTGYYDDENVCIKAFTGGPSGPDPTDPTDPTEPTEPAVNCYYRTHIQNIGWQDTKSNGEVSGTSGYGYRLEAIQIQLEAPDDDIGIAYSTHVQNIGWQDWRYNGDVSGTSGYGLRLEAIQIELVGADADRYDVYYRTHCQNLGWLLWAENGEKSGTSGYGYRLEAIQIEVVPKGTAASGLDSCDLDTAFLVAN